MKRPQLGKYVYAFGGIFFGVVTLTWHQIKTLGDLSHPAALVILVGIAEIIGGTAIQFKKSERVGALTLTAVFTVFSVYWISQVFNTTLGFVPWGNFGEQFSMMLGGVFIIASTMEGDGKRAAAVERFAYVGFGLCVISFALYQLFYLSYTATLVPTWIPPGQMFWSVATTVAFALAAIALFSGRYALLGSRLLTLMLMLFGLIVWLPAIITDPLKMSNWQEFSSNLAITGASWIVTDLLARKDSAPPVWSFNRAPAGE